MTDPHALIRPITEGDSPLINRLHAEVFGPGRFARSAYRVREGTPYFSRYCRVAVLGSRLVAALRLTPARIGGKPGALLLGPLAVDPAFANQGYGRRLVADAFVAAAADGFRVVVLVGDLAYYTRMQFVAAPRGRFWLPGPADPARVLVHELVPGAMAEFGGLVAADYAS